MEKATDKQIAAIMKARLHDSPWTLSKQEAWGIMNDRFGDRSTPQEQYPIERPEYKVPQEIKPTAGKGTSKEFHLSIEECRARALECSIEALKGKSIGEIRELTGQYFNWIWSGE